MERILTQEERAKKVRLNQLIIGIVLISLMVFSTLGYALGRNRDEGVEKVEYSSIEFIRDSDYWSFNIQGYDFITKYNPKEVEDISFLSYLSLQNYVNKPLYFVGNYPEPVSELGRNLDSFVLRMHEACLENMNCSDDSPVKNCSVDNVIVIREVLDGSSESFSEDENCVFITADLGNQTRYADAYLFKLLGIR